MWNYDIVADLQPVCRKVWFQCYNRIEIYSSENFKMTPVTKPALTGGFALLGQTEAVVQQALAAVRARRSIFSFNS
jgi:hypothetical protein